MRQFSVIKSKVFWAGMFKVLKRILPATFVSWIVMWPSNTTKSTPLGAFTSQGMKNSWPLVNAKNIYYTNIKKFSFNCKFPEMCCEHVLLIVSQTKICNIFVTVARVPNTLATIHDDIDIHNNSLPLPVKEYFCSMCTIKAGLLR